jgi:hypothetical protein
MLSKTTLLWWPGNVYSYYYYYYYYYCSQNNSSALVGYPLLITFWPTWFHCDGQKICFAIITTIVVSLMQEVTPSLWHESGLEPKYLFRPYLHPSPCHLRLSAQDDLHVLRDDKLINRLAAQVCCPNYLFPGVQWRECTLLLSHMDLNDWPTWFRGSQINV